MTQKDTILDSMKTYRLYDQNDAEIDDISWHSVRRNVHKLRREGYQIKTLKSEDGTYYRLTRKTPVKLAA